MKYKDRVLNEYHGRQSSQFKDLTGKTFGYWKVICRAPTDKHRTRFWAECKCGRIQKVYSNHLLRGLTTQCVYCSNQEKHPLEKYEDIPKTFWKEFQKRACGEKARESRRHLKFNLTIEDAWNLYIKQNRKCALSGVDIGFCIDFKYKKNGSKYYQHTASLDRIDGNGNYELSNVQWVHKDVNLMKNVFGEVYFLDMCKRITECNS